MKPSLDSYMMLRKKYAEYHAHHARMQVQEHKWLAEHGLMYADMQELEEYAEFREIHEKVETLEKRIESNKRMISEMHEVVNEYPCIPGVFQNASVMERLVLAEMKKRLTHRDYSEAVTVARLRYIDTYMDEDDINRMQKQMERNFNRFQGEI